MLKAKSEVPTIIIQFIDLIFNQFDKRLRIFRSDNAKEFFSSEVNSYMENHGIIHESSCVNYPPPPTKWTCGEENWTHYGICKISIISGKLSQELLG